MDVAMGERFELREGETLVVGEADVDEVQQSDFGVEGAEWLFGGKAESESIGAGTVHARENGGVIVLAEPIGELLAIGLSEAGERGL